MDSDTDTNDTEELRDHIHHLLRDYSRTHYTTNYIEFTESLVLEFVEGLKPVPLTDPHSLVIPPDPFDVFSQMHGLSSLAPYDETFKPTEARSYLKQAMVSPLGISKSERVVWDDDYGKNLPSHEPIFVALSRKSQQATPKLGSKKQSHFPDLHRDLLKHQKIEPIPVEEIEDPPLSIDKILQLELLMDDEDRPAVKSLLKSTFRMLHHKEGYKNKYLDPTFPPDDSLAEEYQRHEAFVPIFPRVRMPGSGTALTSSVSSGLPGLADFSTNILSQVAVGDSDDLPIQNMVVLDGWNTIRSSPPSTPTSMTVDDSDNEIDELLLQSSPNTEPVPIEELFNVQIEVPQFPRARKIGGYAGIEPHILAGKTLGTFIQPLLVKTIRTTMQVNKEPVIERCSSPEPSSLFGQPPSALEYPDKGESSHDVYDALDVEIENLYKGQNLQNFIMDEAIDEKQSFLMEVPDLPEPNVYARRETISPTKFSECFIPPDLKYGDGLPHQFLRKISTQSLNVALSWVVFTTDKKLPTMTGIVDMTDLFDEPSWKNVSNISINTSLEAGLAKAEMMLSFADSPPNPVEHLIKESSDYRPPDLDDGFKMVLNRGEQRRVARLEGRITDMGASDSDDSVDENNGDVQEDSHELDAVPRLAKRPRIDVTDANEQDGSGLLTYDLSLPSFALESHELSTEAEITLRHLGTQTFALLRGKKLASKQETLPPVPPSILLPVEQDRKPRETPEDIYDFSTIRLPESITMPQSIHKYMASIEIIQKQGLVRSLQSQECLVDLVERESLDGVDLILDHHLAVIFLSLFVLPSQCDKYVERVTAQSWNFRRIVVIFEAYPQSCARKGNKTMDSELDAYTPHILKAIKKFRRDLNIAAAYGTKCQETEVLHAFANSVDEAALFTRLCGNFAEENDETGGAIWGDRGWLDVDFLEDEEAKLACVDGMNRFSASIVLCQVSLEDFLNIEPEERIVRFGGFIGADSVEKFNIDLECRTKAMGIMCTSDSQ